MSAKARLAALRPWATLRQHMMSVERATAACRRLLAAWVERQAPRPLPLESLGMLPDHLLRDVGLSRARLQGCELGLPQARPRHVRPVATIVATDPERTVRPLPMLCCRIR